MTLERGKQYSNNYSSGGKYIFKRAACDINQKLDTVNKRLAASIFPHKRQKEINRSTPVLIIFTFKPK